MATGSFNGVDFEVLFEPMSLAAPVEYTERHIPGGDVSYIDYAGRQLQHKSVTAYCANATIFANLQASRGVSGTYTDIDGAVSAFLASITRTILYPGGISESTLEFILL